MELTVLEPDNLQHCKSKVCPVTWQGDIEGKWKYSFFNSDVGRRWW